MEGIGTPESHDWEGGANTFGNILYVESLHLFVVNVNKWLKVTIQTCRHGEEASLSLDYWNGREVTWW
ncbi:unnamed protein product [Staurois parvus]|uniref:Uncharacterized protein n=1 Tax=Staurois parvus TaxID=386267 RepID=A0ABN9GUF4_9NEOB|nr:unnamed protein product [Staurois parvus]